MVEGGRVGFEGEEDVGWRWNRLGYTGDVMSRRIEDCRCRCRRKKKRPQAFRAKKETRSEGYRTMRKK
jgi:hypothetical protein